MKIKNTAPGGRGFGVAGQIVEIGAGETKDVSDSDWAAAKGDPIVKGWLADGTFVEAGKAAAPAAVVAPEPKAKDAK
jgi:hypothetical protein